MLRALILSVLLCLSGLLGAQELKELQPVPPLSARVIDQTATLSADQRARLEARLADFERQKGAQIALLMVSSVKPETVSEYALRVVEKWKLGRQVIDDGVLLLVAKDDHKLRLEVGYGLEGALNDATAKRIISETISPRFKQGDFYGGVDAGLSAVIKVLDGEVLPPPRQKAQRSDSGFSFDNLLLFGFVLVFVVGGILRSLFGRFLGAGIVGMAAGFLATLILPSLLLAIGLGFVAFIVSLLSGMGGGGGWMPGASSWGGGSGGGFSGGGGSFGGGGASGDW
jgi:uncharacterized protein